MPLRLTRRVAKGLVNVALHTDASQREFFTSISHFLSPSYAIRLALSCPRMMAINAAKLLPNTRRPQTRCAIADGSELSVEE